jgi:hypothetical protein
MSPSAINVAMTSRAIAGMIFGYSFMAVVRPFGAGRADCSAAL